MSAILSSFYKTVASAATPEALGAATVLFNTGWFIAQKSATESNTGIVTVQFSSTNNAGSLALYPSVSQRIIADGTSYFTANQVYLDVATAGDGVLFIYSLADWKAYHDAEGKLEQAMVALVETIALTIDDCSVTHGLDIAEKTGDNVHCVVESATELIHDTGLWQCEAKVIIQTPVDPPKGSTERGDQLTKHRLRTAYVRDLFMDGENTVQVLSSSVPGLTVQPRSMINRRLASSVNERKFISEFSFQISCCATQFS